MHFLLVARSRALQIAHFGEQPCWTSIRPDRMRLRSYRDLSERDGYPTWSADGARIAFHTRRDGNWEIYIMQADGSNQVNLTNNPAYDSMPHWSAVQE